MTLAQRYKDLGKKWLPKARAALTEDTEDLTLAEQWAQVSDNTDRLIESVSSTAFFTLDRTERRILARRLWTVDHTDGMTLAEIAEHEGTTRQNVREIQDRAIAKLTHNNPNTRKRDQHND